MGEEAAGEETSGGDGIVEGAYLAGGEGANRAVEGELDAIIADVAQRGGFCGGAVAGLGEYALGQGAAAVGDMADRGAGSVESGSVRAFVVEDEAVAGDVFADDDVGDALARGGDVVSLALADGEEVQTKVMTEHATRGIHDVAGVIGDEVAQEVTHLHLADEADALRVFFESHGQVELARQLAHARLGDAADGENSVRHLLGAHQGEEVGLILVRVVPAQDVVFAAGSVLPLGVVTGRDALKTLFQCVVQQHAELDFAVAEHIRVRRSADAVAFQQVVDDAGAVLFDEIHHAQLNAQHAADGARVLDILLPGALARDAFLIDPVFHVSAHHLVSLLHEQSRGHCAVHPAAHR